MGLLDYYRQFDDMDESEVNARLRERRAAERAVALEHVPPLDLSTTEWPELPDAEVVSASVYQARGRLNGYPDPDATRVLRALAERHYLRSGQIVLGNGASELMKTAAMRVLRDGAEVVFPAPSNPLFALIAARAGGTAVPVPLANGRLDAERTLATIGPRTRMLMLCNPNDPTGSYVPSQELGALLGRVPAQVHVLLDESYIHFQDVEEQDAAMKLVDAFPNLLVFRTFSRAYGLSGLRAGYVVGSASAADLLAALAPMLGVNALTQATVLQALRAGERDVERRRESVIEQRRRITNSLRALGCEVTDSQANFVWFAAPGIEGDELARRLEQSRVTVAPGSRLGDPRFVRAAVRDQFGADRLLAAVREALGAHEQGNSKLAGEPA
jgi:histidinol-phosphate aminotransferase